MRLPVCARRKDASRASAIDNFGAENWALTTKFTTDCGTGALGSMLATIDVRADVGERTSIFALNARTSMRPLPHPLTSGTSTPSGTSSTDRPWIKMQLFSSTESHP